MLNIVGVLVSVLPEQLLIVSQQIVELGGEVHLSSEKGQLVITLEHSDDKVIADTITEIQLLNGVLTAAMVYHQIDEEY